MAFQSSRRALIACVAALIGAGLSPLPRQTVASQARAVRLSLVNVPDDVLRPLLPTFERETGIPASIVYTGRDPFGVAREGKADLVIAHYGHEGVEPFVTSGLGLWPHAVFSNQIVLLGPPDDPAGVRGLTDASEAFRRIARAKARFVVNSSPGVKYVEDIVALTGEARSWESYTDTKLEGPQAALAAARLRGYVLWGLPPFLRFKRQGELKELEPLVTAAPLFQRMMVSVVVNPAEVPAVNADAAKAFERFLLTPKTQAWVEAFRYPDFPHQAWWSAGRHNSARD